MTRTNPDLIANAGIGNAARLKGLAQMHNLRVDLVQQRFALEGAVRRIFTSDHADKFGVTSLKGGALMFFSEGVDPILGRSTTDIDLQLDGFDGTMDDLAAIMRDVLSHVPAIDDGVRFDVSTVRVVGQREGGVPGGAVTCVAQIGNSVVKFKADVGCYAPEHSETLEEAGYPSLLPGQLLPTRIWRQPMEYAIADKDHAAVQHQDEYTRFRDYYDIFVMCSRGQLDDDKLQAAFLKSWPLYSANDRPPVVDDIAAHSEAFAQAKSDVWASLKAQSKWAVETPDLSTVCETIRSRLGPILADINNSSLEYAA